MPPRQGGRTWESENAENFKGIITSAGDQKPVSDRASTPTDVPLPFTTCPGLVPVGSQALSLLWPPAPGQGLVLPTRKLPSRSYLQRWLCRIENWEVTPWKPSSSTCITNKSRGGTRKQWLSGCRFWLGAMKMWCLYNTERLLNGNESST